MLITPNFRPFVHSPSSQEAVRRYPKLSYATGRLGELLNMSNMGRWCCLAFLQGLVLYAVAIRFVAGNLEVVKSIGSPAASGGPYDIDGLGLNDAHGVGGGIYAEGFLLFSCIIVSMQLKVDLCTRL